MIVYETDNCAAAALVQMRPWAKPLSMIAMRKLTHWFPFLSCMGMGLNLAMAAPGVAGAPLKTIEKALIGTLITGPSTVFISTIVLFEVRLVGKMKTAYHLLITHKMLANLVTFSGWWFHRPRNSISSYSMFHLFFFDTGNGSVHYHYHYHQSKTPTSGNGYENSLKLASDCTPYRSLLNVIFISERD